MDFKLRISDLKKQISNKNFLIVLSLFLLFIFFYYINILVFRFGLAVQPSVSTSNATNVSNTYGTLVGDLQDTGSKPVYEKGFEYGLTNLYGDKIINKQNLEINYKTEWNLGGLGLGNIGEAHSLALDQDSNIWIVDKTNNNIKKYSSDVSYLGIITGEETGDGEINNPTDIAIDNDNNIYIVNSNEHVLKFDNSGVYLGSWGGLGDGNNEFRGLKSIASSSDGYIYTLESQDYQRVKKFSSDGSYIASWGTQGNQDGQFNNPSDLILDSGGNVFVLDSGNNRVQKFTNGGNLISKWQSTENPEDGYFANGVSIAVDEEDNIFLLSELGGIQKFDNSGNWLYGYKDELSGLGNIDVPRSLIVGSDGIIYVSNSENDTILSFGQYSFQNTFSNILSNLNCSTTYHFRAYAINEDGTSYGNDQTLTTNSCPATPPEVTTSSATNIGQTTVTLNATVEQFESNNISARGFEYGLTSSYGSSILDSDSTNNSFAKNIMGLTCNTLYHFRAFATNNIGTTYGEDIQFTSASCNAAPTVQTNAADQIEKNSARLNGEMLSTNYGTVIEQGFEFGTTTSYGKTYNQKTLGGYAYIGDLNKDVGPDIERFGQATDLAKDSIGNIYLADIAYDKIFKFTSNGEYITSWGGPGTGDGQFDNPSGIAVANDNTIYVADFNNSRIQKFDSNGNYLSKFGSFGTGDGQFNGPSDIDIDSNGFIYIAETYNNNQHNGFYCTGICTSARIQKFNSNGIYISQWGSIGENDNQFYKPLSLSIDSSNNVFVADYSLGQIKKFDSSGIFITKWGNSENEPDFSAEGKFDKLAGISVDSNGYVYAADSDNHRIQKFDSNGILVKNWGELGIRAPYLESPRSVLINNDGKIIVGAPLHARMFEPIQASTIFSNLAENLNCNTTYHYRAYAINQYGTGYGNDQEFTTAACPNAPVVVTGTTSLISRTNVTLEGSISANAEYRTNVGFQYGLDENYGQSIWENANNTPKSITSLGNLNTNDVVNYPIYGIPVSTAPGSDYYLFSLLENDDDYQVAVSPFGKNLNKSGASLILNKGWDDPKGIAVDSSNRLYVADTGNARIAKYNTNGNLIVQWGNEESGPGKLYYPSAIAVDKDDNVFVADVNRVLVFNSSGSFIKTWNISSDGNTEYLLYPSGIAVDQDGNVFISDSINNRVIKFDNNGTYIRQWGGAGVDNGKLFNPSGISVDENGLVYVVDQYNNRLQIFDNDGNFILKQGKEITDQNPAVYSDNNGNGSGEFYLPFGISVNKNPFNSSTDIFISDAGNYRISKFTYNPGSQTLSSIEFANLADTLKCNTTYNYRAYAESTYGTGYGENQTFTTADCIEIPEITVNSNDATNITLNSGSINGAIAKGKDSINSRGFRYGFSPSYGSLHTEEIDQNPVLLGQISGNNYMINPGQSVFDSQGNIYILDHNYSAIQKRQANGTFIDRFGSYGSSDGKFGELASIAIDSNNNIYVSDYSFGLAQPVRIQKFDSNGNFITKWGTTGDNNDEFGSWYIQLAVDSSNNVYALDTYKNKVHKFDANGNYLSSFGSEGIGNGQFRNPTSIDVNSNNEILVVDSLNERVEKFNSSGVYISQFPIFSNGLLRVDQNNDIYITSNSYGPNIDRYSALGEFINTYNVSSGITGVSFNGENNMYVSDVISDNVYIFSLPQNTTDFDSNIASIQGLNLYCGDTVYYQAYATSTSYDYYFGLNNQTYYGDQKSFNTTNCLQSVVTEQATDVFANSAIINGSFNIGSSNVTARGFQYGETQSYGQSTTENGNFSSSSSFSFALTNLECNTTINYRAYATSSDGTVYGDNKTLTTQSCDSPGVITLDSTNITHNMVTLKGRMAENSSSAKNRGFNYGKTSTYGNTVTNDFHIGPNFVKGIQSFDNEDIATDNQGNLYVSDAINSKIRSYDSEGNNVLDFTPEGHGGESYSWQSQIAAGTDGLIYLSRTYPDQIEVYDQTGSFVRKWGSNGTGNGQFDGIVDITIDNSYSIYVSDSTGRIQKFSKFGVFQGSWNDTGYLAVDSQNRIFVINPFSDGIVKIYNSNGTFISSWGSIGTGEGQFTMPSYYGGLAIDDNDNVLISDVDIYQNTGRMQLFSIDGKYKSEVKHPFEEGKVGLVAATQDNSFYAVSVFDGFSTYYQPGSIIKYKIPTDNKTFDMSIGNLECNTVYHFQAIATNSFGTGTGEDLQFTTSECPTTPTVETKEPVAISASESQLLGDVNESSSNIVNRGFEYGVNDSYGQDKSEDINNVVYEGYQNFNELKLLLTNKDGVSYYAYPGWYNSNSIYKYSSDGTQLGTINYQPSSDDEYPLYADDMAEDSQGNLYVADSQNNFILKFNSNGILVNKWSQKNDSFTSYYSAIAVDSLDNVYVLDFYQSRIDKYDSNGFYLTSFGNNSDGDYQTNRLALAKDIVIDKDNRIYITDTGSMNIKVFDTSGNFIDTFGEEGDGDGQFSASPDKIVVDELGNIYVSDFEQYSSDFIPNKVVIFDNQFNFSKEIIESEFDIFADYETNVQNMTINNNSLNINIYNNTLTFSLFDGIEEFGSSINQLECNDTLHYRAFAENSIGIGYGLDKILSMPACAEQITLPTVETIDADLITTSGARIQGTITNSGSSNITQKGFQYGLTTSYGSQVVESSSTTGSFSLILSNLPCNTTYHYRALASNNSGTSYGSDKQFKTNACQSPPVVSITAPINNQNFGSKITKVDLIADAFSTTSTIKQVDFYVDGVYLGTSVDNPYKLIATGLSPGTYTLVAIAYDVLGVSTTSMPVLFNVLPPGGVTPTPTTNPGTNTPVTTISTNNPPAIVVEQLQGENLGKVSTNRLAIGLSQYEGIKLSYNNFANFFLSLLLLMALIYSIQAWREYKRKKEIIKLLNYYQQLSQNVVVFLQITSHYLNTPLTILKTSMELFKTTKLLSENISNDINTTLNELSSFISYVENDSKSLLGSNNVKAQQKLDRVKLLDTLKNKKLWKVLIFTAIPIAIVDTIAIIKNAYTNSTLQLLNHLTVYLMGVFIVYVALQFHSSQKNVKEFKQRLVFEENTLHDQHIKYLNQIADNINKYYQRLLNGSQLIKEINNTKIFFNGLYELDSVRLSLTRASSFLSLDKIKAQISLNNMYEEVIDDLSNDIKNKNIKITSRIDPDAVVNLPPDEAKFLISCLLGNAVKFSNNDSEINIQVVRKKKIINIKVSDSGIGISDEVLKKLFNPFVRGTSTENFNFEGMGLGLYSLNILVNKLNGKLSIKNKNDGVVSEISIPVKSSISEGQYNRIIRPDN